MTTAYYSTTWNNSTSAGFQAWGSALSAAMQSCGLSQTSDTGQINWSTVAVPTTANTSAGYEIYQFTDALQSTYPIFVKIEYGTGPNQTTTGDYPQIWFTVGEGSNGSGTLTGTLTTRQNVIANYNASGSITNTTVPYPTYICFDGSYLGVAHKIGGMTTYNGAGYSGGMFMIGRACNSSGTYVGGLITAISSPLAPNSTAYPFIIQCINTTTSTLYSATTGYFSIVPFSMTATTIVSTGNYQIFPCYSIYNTVTAISWCAYGLTAETTQGNTVTAAIVGSSSQTYLMTGAASTGACVPATAAYALLMKYQ